MTDKVQKIKDWISKEQDGLMDAQGNFEYPEHEGAYHILCNLDTYIDSLQEEPASEDLEEARRAVEIAREEMLNEICEWIGKQKDLLKDSFSDPNDFADILKQAVKDET